MQIDWSKAVAVEKVDGSLIKIYNHKGHWYVSTKGTAYADSDCMGYGITFFELVLVALGCKNDSEFQKKCEYANLYKGFTYIFELTSVENRVVKRYDGYKLHYLAARDNSDGEYVTTIGDGPAMELGAHKIKEYRFSSTEECMMAARNLKNLDEGFVIFQDGVPIAKIKSPAYVAVHHIRGEGLNPKRIMQLVLTNEQDEYLQYFPDDRVVMQPYIDAKALLDLEITNVWSEVKSIVDQKEFAFTVGKYKFKAALFSARMKGIDVLQALNDQRDSYKMEILKEYVK